MNISNPILRRVFVDTSAFYALIDARDNDHASAITLRDWLIAEHAPLFTTNFVLVEMHALLLSRLDHATALRVLEEIDRSDTTIIRASAKDEQRARAILQKYQDKDFSLCDAISFAAMERLKISSVFAFDRHFTQYGFSSVIPK